MLFLTEAIKLSQLDPDTAISTGKPLPLPAKEPKDVSCTKTFPSLKFLKSDLIISSSCC